MRPPALRRRVRPPWSETTTPTPAGRHRGAIGDARATACQAERRHRMAGAGARLNRRASSSVPAPPLKEARQTAGSAAPASAKGQALRIRRRHRAGPASIGAGAVDHAQQRCLAQQARRERRLRHPVAGSRASAVADEMQAPAIVVGDQRTSAAPLSAARSMPRLPLPGRLLARGARSPAGAGGASSAASLQGGAFAAVSGGCRPARRAARRPPASGGRPPRGAPAAAFAQLAVHSLSLHPFSFRWSCGLQRAIAASRRLRSVGSETWSSAASCCMVGSSPVAGSRQASG
jgi:hypothetical protein